MKLKKASIILLLSLLLAISLMQIRQVQAPSSTIFMDFFSEWSDYIHSKLNTTNFALYHDYYITSEKDWSDERWNLAYHALFCTFAYEHTNDAKYLFEAQYFCDNLEKYTASYDGTLTIYVTKGENHWLYADAALLWAEQKLNEYGWGNYNVTGTVDHIISVADKSTADYLGWAYYWGQGQIYGMCYNTYILFEGLLAYLTNKNIKDYTTQLQKIVKYVEETGRFTSGDHEHLYRYNEGDTSPSTYSWHIPYGYLLLDYYVKGIVNYTAIDLTIAKLKTQWAWSESVSSIYLGAPLYELITLANRETPDIYQIAFKRMCDDISVKKPFCLSIFTSGGRGMCFRVAYFMLVLGISKRTSKISFDESSWFLVDNVYHMNATFNQHHTMIKNTDGFEMFHEEYGHTTMWTGLGGVTYDTFEWNSTGKYYRGFKAGFGSLTNYDVTTYFYQNGEKTENWFKNVLPYGSYYNSRFYSTGLANTAHIHLVFSNRTWFNVTALSSPTIIYTTEYFGLLQSGRFYIFKTNNASNAVEIWVNANIRTVYAYATYYLSVPRGFNPEANNMMTTSWQAKYIEDYLIDYVAGTDKKDEKIDTAEGNIKWQLKHYSDLSIQTDKNMTSSSLTVDKLKLTISAQSAQTSTTKVYVSTRYKPKTVSGATSWTYDDSTKTITITVTHSSSQEIIVDWIGVIEGGGKYFLTVYVKTNGLPTFNAKIIIDGQVGWTNLLGEAKFQLSGGRYTIICEYANQTQTKDLTIYANMNIGFNFETPPEQGWTPPLSMILIPFIIVGILLFIMYKKR